MSKKAKETICMVLTITVTAAVFFLLGTMAQSIFGINQFQTTRIEYVPKTTASTSTTTTTVTSSKDESAVGSTTATTLASSTTESVASGKINLNTATKEELMSVPGIGETYAKRIIEYRDSVGGFSSLEELMEIEGIGTGRFESWSPYFTLS